MKIWTITYNDDNGVNTEVVNTEAEADKKAQDWISSSWEYCTKGRETVAPMPEDWREAYDALCEQLGFMDSISVIEHLVFPPDNSNDPYVKAAQRVHTDWGRLEVDYNALVSKGEDSGAYVQAWVWVTDEEAGVAE